MLDYVVECREGIYFIDIFLFSSYAFMRGVIYG